MMVCVTLISSREGKGVCTCWLIHAPVVRKKSQSQNQSQSRRLEVEEVK